jgi:hypothetical protein
VLQSPEFINNRIHTGWLDSRIAAQVQNRSLHAWLATVYSPSDLWRK